MTDPNATYQNATLLKFARAALTRTESGGDVPWEEFDLSDPEQRRFGDYELRELLGRGGMGVVYRAWQEELGRDVAIKFIAMDFADDATIIGRFLDEARAAARLHHPHIVPVFEVGSADCLHYFTMPLMRGRTLADLAKGGTLSTTDKVVLLRKLCSAVSYAHSLGMLHLDLKPENVMLDQHEQPLIGDFGLARQMDDAGEVTAQEVSGTPAFMAPEQVQIRQFRLTERTDVYALGAILYRLLTGESPHGRGGAQELMQNAVAGRIRPVRSLSPMVDRDLAAICERCLELQPADRYPSAAALEEDLGRYLDGNAVSVRRAGFIERTRRAVARNPGVALASAAAIFAMVVGLLLTTWQWRSAEEARTLAEDRAGKMSQLAQMIAVIHPESRWDRVEDPVDALVRWLRDHGGTPEEQRDLLASFIEALKAAGKSAVLEDLLWVIQFEMGREFREGVADDLSTSDDRNELIASILLTATSHERLWPTLQRLDALHEHDPLALHVIAQHCEDEALDCATLDLRKRLREHAPEMMIAWLYGMEDAMDEASLRAMADQPILNDGLEDMSRVIFETVSEREPPPEIVVPLEAFVSEQDAHDLAQLDTSFLPIVGLAPLTGVCNPSKEHYAPEFLDACVRLGLGLLDGDRHGIITRLIGGVIIRRVQPDSPDAKRAYDLRRQYQWISETAEDRNAELEPHARDGARVMLEVGALQAFFQWAEQAGIPLQPPENWVPRNPNSMLLPEERTRQQ